MFTGLIQGVGRVKRHATGLLIQGCNSLETINLGDSIAVDGVCLTAMELIPDGFVADVSEETLSRTTLALKADEGGEVNLELALRFSDRLGGHLVSGHVDGIGEIEGLDALDHSWKVEVKCLDPSLGRYICEKGSISVNGVSLTVAGCMDGGGRFWVSVIPHTWSHTSLKQLLIGAPVNLEVDLIAKYSEQLIRSYLSPQGKIEMKIKDDISKDWLATHGWV